MLNSRSLDKSDCRRRVVYAVLLCLAVHCVVAYEQGARRGEIFDVRNLSRAVSLLIGGTVVGCVAAVFWPKTLAGKSATPVPATTRATPAAPARPVAKPPVERSPVERKTVARSLPKSSAEGMPVSPVGVRRDKSLSSAQAVQCSSPATMAEQVWKMARTLSHNYIPRVCSDRRYLGLMHGAAMAGHVEAQSKLAEYAVRRGTLVEAYYWLKLMQLNGVTGLEARLYECRTKWVARGCPSERSNVHAFFTERQCSLGRAVLRLDTGMLVNKALAQLSDLSAEGEPVAALVLDQRDRRLKARGA